MIERRIEADTGNLLGHSTAFGKASHDLTVALRQCRQVLDGLGDVYGKDEAGAKVAAACEPLRELVEQGLTQKIVPGLDSVDAALAGMAHNHTETDQANQAAVFRAQRLDRQDQDDVRRSGGQGTPNV